MGGIFGACHGPDVPLVFGNLDRGQPAMLIGGSPEQSSRLSWQDHPFPYMPLISR